MKSTTVSHAKAHLSALLRRVQRGETVVICSRGRPIARLEPVRAVGDEEDRARLERLVRSGIVRPPLEEPDWAFLSAPTHVLTAENSLVRALLAERAEGER